jgi:hypothetical protein
MVNKLAPVLVLALASTAHAGPIDPLVHADGGVEMEGSSQASSVSFRGQLLLGNSFGSGRVRPEIAAGALLGAGTLFAPDPRAVDGAVGLSMYSFGPEVQLGLQLYRDGEPTTRVFASLAYMRVQLDDRLMIDPIPGVGGDHGERAAFGVNFARTLLRSDRCAGKHDCDAVFMLLLPHQAEFATERDGGSTRYGVTLSWGS